MDRFFLVSVDLTWLHTGSAGATCSRIFQTIQQIENDNNNIAAHSPGSKK